MAAKECNHFHSFYKMWHETALIYRLNLPCVKSADWWSGIRTFFWHTFADTISHCLNVLAYLSVVADHVHLFMATSYCSVMVTKLTPAVFFNMTISSVLFSGLSQSLNLNPIEPIKPLRCSKSGDVHLENLQDCLVQPCQHGPEYQGNISNILWNPSCDCT